MLGVPGLAGERVCLGCLLKDVQKSCQPPGGLVPAQRAPASLPPSSPLQVVGSPPESLVDTFFELLPQGSPSDFQRMLDLKVGVGKGGGAVDLVDWLFPGLGGVVCG